jgi:hypothetical protein
MHEAVAKSANARGQHNQSPTISSRVISSLAMLKVNWDVLGHDYIQNFVPFAAEVIRTAQQPQISLPEVQAAIAQKFGLQIPQGALKSILHRCAKLHLIHSQNKIYVRNGEALDKLGFALERADALRQHNAVTEKLRQFCKDSYKVDWTSQDADSALHEYIQDRSPAILAAAIEGSPILPPAANIQNADFLVNAFVRHLSSNDPEGFNFLETVVKGSMLANVLIFPELGKVRRHFENVEVYFDTGFIIGALGLEGDSRQDSCRELLSLLYAQGARLLVFEHTRDEVIGVLDAAANGLRCGRRPSQMDYFEHLAGRNYTPSDIELVVAKLSESLRSLRMTVIRRPAQVASLGLDERKLETIIDEQITYRKERAKQMDMDSLTAIHRLRKGSTYPNVESCKAIFVTTNSNLVRAAFKYFSAEYERTTVPLAIRSDTLTTIVWLKQPVLSELPRKIMIADCYAAMKPPERLWRKYLQEIDKLVSSGSISENDYSLLRYSTEARRALMEFTLGAHEEFAEGTVVEVLAFAQNAIRAESSEALASADAELRKERDLRLRSEIDKQKAVAATQTLYEAQFVRPREISVLAGNAVRLISTWSLVSIIFLGTYFTLPKPFPQPNTRWVDYLAPVLLFTLGVVTIFHLIFGTTVRDIARKLELAVAKRAEQFILKIMPPAKPQ